VQLVVEAAVDPGDPDQREDHCKIGEAAPRQVQGQVARVLRDEHDDGEVVEELERADYALARLLAMCPWRLPQQAA
jgi:hypothetical protein